MHERIRRRIGLLLPVPVVATLAVLAVFYAMSVRLAPQALYVDAAGRQRLLTEQLAAALPPAAADRAALERWRRALAAYEANLAILRHGGELRGARVPAPPAAVLAAVAALEARAVPLRSAASPAALGTLLPQLLADADAVLEAHHQWRRGMHRWQWLLLVLLAGLGVATLLAVRNYMRAATRERDRLERFYRALAATGAAVIRSRDRHELFEAVCRIAVERGGVVGAWIGEPDAAGRRLVPVAWHGVDPAALAPAIPPGDDRPGPGAPAVAALHSADPVVSNDPGGDTPWPAAARAAGIRACAAFALRADGRPVGTLNLYAGEPGFFSADLVELLARMAEDLSHALDFHAQLARRALAEDELRRAGRELERRVAERTAALGESHQLLSAVFEATPVLIAYLDPQLRFVRVNRAYAAADGRTPEFFPGRGHFELYPDAANEAIFRRAVETGEPVRVTARPFEYARKPERGVSHWDWSLTPIRDPGGRVTGLVLALLDVTERVVALEQLQASENDLEALNDTLEQRVAARTAELKAERNLTAAILDVVGALVVVLDRDGRIVRFNKYCEAVTGYRFEELAGQRFWDILLGPEDRPAVIEVFGQLARGQFPNRHENDWLTRGGERRRIAWSNNCLTGADGEVTHVIGTGVDITDSRRTEAALRASEARFRNLVESTHDWIWEVDEHGVYVYASPQVRALLGYAPHEVLGRTPFDFMPEDEAARVRTLFAGLAAARAPITGLVNVNRHRDGRLVTLETSGVPVLGEDGAFRGYRGIDRDITERRRAERERLEEVQRQRETLVREVHHRIKNNLQGVVGLLRQQAARQPAMATLLEAAIAQVNAVAVVHGLQGRSRSERLLLCEMTAAICDAVAGLTGVAVEVAFRQRMPLAIDLPQAEAVPVALIVNELVTNAVKHGGAPVRADLRRDGARVCIEVRNRGRLPDGFDAGQRPLGTGLALVRALLPRPGADFTLRHDRGEVIAELRLGAPLIEARP